MVNTAEQWVQSASFNKKLRTLGPRGPCAPRIRDAEIAVMTQGRLKTVQARSAKAAVRKAAGKRKPARKAAAKASRKKSATKQIAKPSRKKSTAKVAKPSRKKSAANRAPKISPKISTVAEVSASPKASANASRSKRTRVVVEQPKKLRPPSPRRPVQLGLGFDDTQDALAVLQQQNKRLMSKIGKRRASLALLRQLSEELMQEASQRVLPYREELKALTRELLDLESNVLGADKLVGRNRDQVRLVFHELLKGLPQDELDAEAEQDADVTVSAGASSSPSTNDTQGNGPRESSAQSRDETRPAEYAAASDAGSGPQQSVAADEPTLQQTTTPQSEAAQPEARSADKPAGDHSGALRSLFKRLVIQWHPDRVRDEAQKAERTKLLKEFTQAFEGADLAKLVALEQTLALKNAPTQPADTPEKRAEQLRRANTELLKQLGELQASLEAVREDCPFTLDYRKKDPASSARDELDEFVLVNHLKVQRATATRDFVLSFARGKMKLAEFLQGPRRSN